MATTKKNQLETEKRRNLIELKGIVFFFKY